MNGHHADCSCQSCTIGREIGMDRALELIREMRGSMWGAAQMLDKQLEHFRKHLGGHYRMPALEEAMASISHADAFLSEHAEHE